MPRKWHHKHTSLTFSSNKQVFILHLNFHERKIVKKALTSFFALGPQTADRILAKYSIYPTQRLGTLSPKTVLQLTAELSVMTIDNDARKAVQDNIHRLREMGTYRGRRHAVGLPVRGQRARNQIATPVKLNRLDRFGKW